MFYENECNIWDQYLKPSLTSVDEDFPLNFDEPITANRTTKSEPQVRDRHHKYATPLTNLESNR